MSNNTDNNNNISSSSKFESGSDWSSKSGSSNEELLDLDLDMEEDIMSSSSSHSDDDNRSPHLMLTNEKMVHPHNDPEKAMIMDSYRNENNLMNPLFSPLSPNNKGSMTDNNETISPTSAIVMMKRKKGKKDKKNKHDKNLMTTMAGIMNPYGCSSDSDSESSSLTYEYDNVSSLEGGSVDVDEIDDEDDDVEVSSVRSQDTPIPKVPPPVHGVSPRKTNYLRRSKSSSSSSSTSIKKREETKVSRLVAMAKQQHNFAQAWFAAATSRNSNALPKYKSDSRTSFRNNKRRYRYSHKNKDNNSSSTRSSGPIDVDSGNSWNDEDDNSTDDQETIHTQKVGRVIFCQNHWILLITSVLCLVVAAIAFVIVMALRIQQNQSNAPPNLPQIETTTTPQQLYNDTSQYPTLSPSYDPSTSPTISSSQSPSRILSQIPSSHPSIIPSMVPSMKPSRHPSVDPTVVPSFSPSAVPTVVPSEFPTQHPSVVPSMVPSVVASSQPSLSSRPTDVPSMVPTTEYSARVYLPLGQSVPSNHSNDDYHGYSVALSRDGTVKAVGARYYPSSAKRRGSVSIYKYYQPTNTWMPMGSRLEGLNDKDEFGYSIALSSDGSILAASEPTNENSRGNVRVFQFNNQSQWQPMGNTTINIDIPKEVNFFGTSISLSGNGTILAVGAPYGGPFMTGRVHIFHYIDNDWTPMGNYLEGSEVNDYFGWDVSLSVDGQYLACGGPRRPAGGFVRIYQWNGQLWNSKGSDIAPPDNIGSSTVKNRFGWSVSISDDGNRVAIGSPNTTPQDDMSIMSSGMATVFSFQQQQQSWKPWGVLYGDMYRNQQFGWSVALSGDGNHLAVGAPGYQSTTGAVFLHQYSPNTQQLWDTITKPLLGSDVLEEFGWDVAITPNGNTVCVGSPYKRNNVVSGLINVYSYQQKQPT